MGKINFQSVWANYPNSDPCIDKKTNQPPKGFSNQCAVRLGYALELSGVSFASYKGKRCPSAPKNSGMVASAQELANWLYSKPFDGCPKAESFTGKNVFENIKGKTGIIFLANYWQRTGEIGNTRTGDHIDLWNGSSMKASYSWIRVHTSFSIDGWFSDYRLATNALFWNIS